MFPVGIYLSKIYFKYFLEIYKIIATERKVQVFFNRDILKSIIK